MSDFTDAVHEGLQGMDAVSTGSCPGCGECMDIDGYDDAAKHREAWQTSDLPSGGEYFSWRPCGICGTRLGGNRHNWHWIDPNDPTHTINHESDACDDCAIYLANGDEPDSWRA